NFGCSTLSLGEIQAFIAVSWTADAEYLCNNNKICSAWGSCRKSAAADTRDDWAFRGDAKTAQCLIAWCIPERVVSYLASAAHRLHFRRVTTRVRNFGNGNLGWTSDNGKNSRVRPFLRSPLIPRGNSSI